jgi:hypothetical protein
MGVVADVEGGVFLDAFGGGLNGGHSDGTPVGEAGVADPGVVGCPVVAVGGDLVWVPGEGDGLTGSPA